MTDILQDLLETPPACVSSINHVRATVEISLLRAENAEQAKRIAGLTKEINDVYESTAYRRMQATIAAQAAVIEMARDALEGVCDSDEECEDADGWTAAVISLESLHVAQEALDAIASLPQSPDADRTAQSAWQQIETAPKDGTEILAWWESSRGYGKLGWHISYFSNRENTNQPYSEWRVTSNIIIPPWAKPTHWQPLPPAPDAAMQVGNKLPEAPHHCGQDAKEGGA